MRAVLHAPAPVMLFDGSGRVLLLSRAWLQATGWTMSDMRSIRDWHATASSQGDARTVASFLHHAIEQETAKQCGEFKFLSKTGKRCDWSLVVSALGLLANGGRLFICIAHDVTDDREAEARSKDSELHFRQLLEALPTAVYTTDSEGRLTFYNKAAGDMWGYRPALGALWCGSWRLYWPDGRPMSHDECPMAIALRDDRSVRGMEAIAERPDGTRVPFIPYPTPLHDASGRLVGAVNMLIDITARKRSERRLRLLAREVDHRTKNMLAVIQGLVHFTRAETARDFADAIEGRIMALARAHSLLSDNQWDGADIRILVEQELETHRVVHGDRIRVHGKSVILDAAAAQSTALIFHELVTNAAKHGALRADAGRVDAYWTCDSSGQLSLIWMETGGPSTSPPQHKGFGLTLIERTIADQLDGKVEFDWHATGLICRCQIPIGQGAAPAHSDTAN